MVKADYLPFGEAFGDGRALFMDITLASVMGVDLPPIQSARASKLKLQDPRIVKNTIKIIKTTSNVLIYTLVLIICMSRQQFDYHMQMLRNMIGLVS